MECASDISKIAERIKKILYDRQVKPKSVIEDSTFPKVLENEVEIFMQQYSLDQTGSMDEEEEDGNESDENMAK